MVLEIITEIPQLHAELESSKFDRYSDLFNEYPDLFTASLSIQLPNLLTYGLINPELTRVISSIVDISISEITNLNKHLYQFYYTLGQCSQAGYTELYNFFNLDIRTIDHYIYPIIPSTLLLIMVPYNLITNFTLINILTQTYLTSNYMINILYQMAPRYHYHATLSDRIYQITIPLKKIFRPINPKLPISMQTANDFFYHLTCLTLREMIYGKNVMLYFRRANTFSRLTRANTSIGNYYALIGRGVDKITDTPRAEFNMTNRIFEHRTIQINSIIEALIKISRYTIWSFASILRFAIPTFDCSSKGEIDQMILYYMLPRKIMEQKVTEKNQKNIATNLIPQNTIYYTDKELKKYTISQLLKSCEQEIGWPRSFLYIPKIHSLIIQPKYKIGDYYYSIYEIICIVHTFAETLSDTHILTQQELQRLTISNTGSAGNIFSCVFNIHECFKKSIILNILFSSNNMPIINMQEFIKETLLKANDYERVINNIHKTQNWITKTIQSWLKENFVKEQNIKCTKMLNQAILHNKIAQTLKLKKESQNLYIHLLENLVDKIDENEISAVYFQEERTPNYKINNYMGTDFILSEYTNITLPIPIHPNIKIQMCITVNSSKSNMNPIIRKLISLITNIHSLQDILHMLSFEAERITYESQYKYAHTYGTIIQEAPWRLLEHLKYEIEQYIPNLLSIIMPSSSININRVYYAYLKEALKNPYIQTETLQKTTIPILSLFDCMAFHSTYIETFAFFNNLSCYTGFDSWSIQTHTLNRIFTNIFWKSILSPTIKIPVNYIKFIISKLPRTIVTLQQYSFTFTFDIKKIILGRHYQMEACLKSNSNMSQIFTSKITPLINEAFSCADRYPILNCFNLIMSSFSLGSILQAKGSSFALCTGYAISQYRPYILPFNIQYHAQAANIATRDSETLISLLMYKDINILHYKIYKEKLNTLLNTIKNPFILREHILANYPHILVDITTSAFTLSANYANQISYMILIPLKSYFIYGDSLIHKLLDFDIYSSQISNFFSRTNIYNQKYPMRFEFNIRDILFNYMLQICLAFHFRAPLSYLLNQDTDVGIDNSIITWKSDGIINIEEIISPLIGTYNPISTLIKIINSCDLPKVHENRTLQIIEGVLTCINQVPHLIPHLLKTNIKIYKSNINKNIFKIKQFIPYILTKHNNISFVNQEIFYKEATSTYELYIKLASNVGFSINPLQALKIIMLPTQQIRILEQFLVPKISNYNNISIYVPHIFSMIRYLITHTIKLPYVMHTSFNITNKLIWFMSQINSPQNTNFLELCAQESMFTTYVNTRIGTIAIGINPEYLYTPSTFQFISIELFHSIDFANKTIQHMSTNKILSLKSISHTISLLFTNQIKNYNI